MNKNELELRKHAINSQNVGAWTNLAQHVVTAIAVVVSVKIIFDGLNGLVQSNPSALGALATVVEKLQISAILGYVVAGLATLGYVYERKGKKRAIRKLDDMRGEVEREDPYKAPSQLDENGHTPK